MDMSSPTVVIGDRDPRWLSDFFKGVFRRLNIKFLATTAYHPQTDGQSERTNQTVEVAIRYWLAEHVGASWAKYLPQLQATLNNSRNATTGFAPNEVITGTRTNLDSLRNLDLLTDSLAGKRGIIQKEVEDAVAFANARMKDRYDAKHKPLMLKPGDKALLRLGHGYKLQGEGGKMAPCFEGPFKVLRRIGPLAFKLALPPAMSGLHPVFSITQLEKPPQEPDPFGRQVHHEPGPVVTAATEDPDETPSYEMSSDWLLGSPSDWSAAAAKCSLNLPRGLRIPKSLPPRRWPQVGLARWPSPEWTSLEWTSMEWPSLRKSLQARHHPRPGTPSPWTAGGSQPSGRRCGSPGQRDDESEHEQHSQSQVSELHNFSTGDFQPLPKLVRQIAQPFCPRRYGSVKRTSPHRKLKGGITCQEKHMPSVTEYMRRSGTGHELYKTAM